MKTYQLRIDGRAVDPAVGKWFDAQNPNPETWGARGVLPR